MDFLRHIRVVPQSIVSSVDQNTVIVDPAGLPFIQGDVAIDKAGGASGAIYETIGIDGFPAEVIESITAPTDAAWWQYENKASPSSPYVVIHVAGPTQASKERNCVLAYAVGSLHLWASHLPPLGFTLASHCFSFTQVNMCTNLWDIVHIKPECFNYRPVCVPGGLPQWIPVTHGNR